VDGGVGAVSINPSGRDVVLAGHRGLYVVDLDDPFSPPRWIQHLTSWEVADVQWSPHPSKPAWVISTSNQKAMLWNLARTGDNAIEHVLHEHSRAITDINFHPDNPELLATCSVDTSILAWDMRSPKRPFYSVADWRAGASQVKWNFQNPNLLASSHDNHFYIWDLRNNAKPLHRIDAHSRKINGVDFSRTKENEIISSSNDCSVKFWDISKSTENPTSIVNTEFPVWRARHLPFGHGCAIMPLRGGSNAIYLVNQKNLTGTTTLQPSSVFKGHTDRVTDFLWRERHTNSGLDDREFQLVTWSKDCDLRLWSLDDEVYDKLDFERNVPKELPVYDYKTYLEEPERDLSNQPILQRTKDTFVSRKGDSITSTKDHLNWISGVRIGRSAFIPTVDQNPNNLVENTPANLGEEVTIIGHKFPKVKFEKISVSTGILVISLNGPWGAESDELIFLRVEIKIPKEYPANPPTFRIEENSNLDSTKRQDIISNLNTISNAYSKYGKFSLESSLRFIMGEKIDLTKLEQDSDDQQDEFDNIPFDDLTSLPSSVSSEMEEGDDDDDDEYDELIPLIASEVISSKLKFDSTPIPKGCGACWTKTGQLVCFFIPKNQEKEQKIIKFDERGFSNQVFFDYENTSDDSLSDDWNDILKNDATTRSKIPGVFRIQNYNTNTERALSTERSFPTATGKQDTPVVNKNIVAIFDMNYLIPSKMELADEYRIIGDTPKNLALHNAEVCAKHNFNDIADSWRMLSTIFNDSFYWGTHPFGRFWFVKELMDYYEKLGNVQMLAMMSCIIQGPNQAESMIKSTSPPIKERTQSISSHAQSNGSDSNYRLPFSRSSSVLTTDRLEKEISVKVEMMNEVELGYKEDSFGFTLLDGNDEERFNNYREEYANILYNWGQVLRRAEILKFNYKNTCMRNDPHQGKITWYENANKDCSYCGLKVNRRLFSCFNCEHMLHADCASEWFGLSNDCPSGCGCLCIDAYKSK
jgi:WD40 repeat protein